MATADPIQIFNKSVDCLFQGWTVLQLAVQHGFGGQHSREKAEWMVESVCNWFQENAGIEPHELEDFIASILDNEFDTRADDGSLQVIARNICRNFALCKAGQATVVAESIEQIPKANISRCIADVTEESEDISMDDSGISEHNVNAMMNGMDINSTSQHNSHQEQDSTQNQTTNELPATDPDGWTVVRKPKKR